MYNLVKGICHKLTHKDQPVDPVPNLIAVEPIFEPLIADIPTEVIYVVLNDFEMETMIEDAVKEVPVIVEEILLVDVPVVEEVLVVEPIDEIFEEVVKKPKKPKKSKNL